MRAAGALERWSGLDTSLTRSELDGCELSLESPLAGFLELSVKPKDGPGGVAEIYEHTLRIEESPEGVRYFSDSVNQKAPASFYATQTLVWADKPGAPARRLEVRFCDSIRLEDGAVPYEESLPFFPCEVPVRTILCE